MYAHVFVMWLVNGFYVFGLVSVPVESLEWCNVAFTKKIYMSNPLVSMHRNEKFMYQVYVWWHNMYKMLS